MPDLPYYDFLTEQATPFYWDEKRMSYVRWSFKGGKTVYQDINGISYENSPVEGEYKLLSLNLPSPLRRSGQAQVASPKSSGFSEANFHEGSLNLRPENNVTSDPPCPTPSSRGLRSQSIFSRQPSMSRTPSLPAGSKYCASWSLSSRGQARVLDLPPYETHLESTWDEPAMNQSPPQHSSRPSSPPRTPSQVPVGRSGPVERDPTEARPVTWQSELGSRSNSAMAFVDSPWPGTGAVLPAPFQVRMREGSNRRPYSELAAHRDHLQRMQQLAEHASLQDARAPRGSLGHLTSAAEDARTCPSPTWSPAIESHSRNLQPSSPLPGAKAASFGNTAPGAASTNVRANVVSKVADLVFQRSTSRRPDPTSPVSLDGAYTAMPLSCNSSPPSTYTAPTPNSKPSTPLPRSLSSNHAHTQEQLSEKARRGSGAWPLAVPYDPPRELSRVASELSAKWSPLDFPCVGVSAQSHRMADSRKESSGPGSYESPGQPEGGVVAPPVTTALYSEIVKVVNWNPTPQNYHASTRLRGDIETITFDILDALTTTAEAFNVLENPIESVSTITNQPPLTTGCDMTDNESVWVPLDLPVSSPPGGGCAPHIIPDDPWSPIARQAAAPGVEERNDGQQAVTSPTLHSFSYVSHPTAATSSISVHHQTLTIPMVMSNTGPPSSPMRRHASAPEPGGGVEGRFSPLGSAIKVADGVDLNATGLRRPATKKAHQGRDVSRGPRRASLTKPSPDRPVKSDWPAGCASPCSSRRSTTSQDSYRFPPSSSKTCIGHTAVGQVSYTSPTCTDRPSPGRAHQPKAGLFQTTTSPQASGAVLSGPAATSPGSPRPWGHVCPTWVRPTSVSSCSIARSFARLKGSAVHPGESGGAPSAFDKQGMGDGSLEGCGFRYRAFPQHPFKNHHLPLGVVQPHAGRVAAPAESVWEVLPSPEDIDESARHDNAGEGMTACGEGVSFLQAGSHVVLELPTEQQNSPVPPSAIPGSGIPAYSTQPTAGRTTTTPSIGTTGGAVRPRSAADVKALAAALDRKFGGVRTGRDQGGVGGAFGSNTSRPDLVRSSSLSLSKKYGTLLKAPGGTNLEATTDTGSPATLTFATHPAAATAAPFPENKTAGAEQGIRDGNWAARKPLALNLEGNLSPKNSGGGSPRITPRAAVPSLQLQFSRNAAPPQPQQAMLRQGQTGAGQPPENQSLFEIPTSRPAAAAAQLDSISVPSSVAAGTCSLRSASASASQTRADVMGASHVWERGRTTTKPDIKQKDFNSSSQTNLTRSASNSSLISKLSGVRRPPPLVLPERGPVSPRAPLSEPSSLTARSVSDSEASSALPSPLPSSRRARGVNEGLVLFGNTLTQVVLTASSALPQAAEKVVVAPECGASSSLLAAIVGNYRPVIQNPDFSFTGVVVGPSDDHWRNPQAIRGSDTVKGVTDQEANSLYYSSRHRSEGDTTDSASLNAVVSPGLDIAAFPERATDAMPAVPPPRSPPRELRDDFQQYQAVVAQSKSNREVIGRSDVDGDGGKLGGGAGTGGLSLAVASKDPPPSTLFLLEHKKWLSRGVGSDDGGGSAWAASLASRQALLQSLVLTPVRSPPTSPQCRTVRLTSARSACLSSPTAAAMAGKPTPRGYSKATIVRARGSVVEGHL